MVLGGFGLRDCDPLAQLRVQLCFLWRHRRFARLREPRTLTDHIQRRKLIERDPLLPLLTDKVAAKAHVGATLGRHWITPTLWRGTALPDEPAWPMPFVVKARHGCGQTMVVFNRADYAQALRLSRRWMRSPYGRWLDEWAYGEVPLGLLVEPYLETGAALPVDYKLFVFGGRAHFVQVHLDRAAAHRWVVFDPHWQQVSPAACTAAPPRPSSLRRMIWGAEKLGERFPFVRVDLYDVGGQPRFGEMTFYPGSGLEPVEPASLDRDMGRLWSGALASPRRGSHLLDLTA